MTTLTAIDRTPREQVAAAEADALARLAGDMRRGAPPAYIALCLTGLHEELDEEAEDLGWTCPACGTPRPTWTGSDLTLIPAATLAYCDEACADTYAERYPS